jgi:hypothetical protein
LSPFPAASETISSISGIIDWLDNHREKDGHGFQDQLIEIFEDEKEGLRWALTPNIVQHIGSKSSKIGTSGEWGGNDARARLWSYGFEKEGKRINRYDLKSDDGRR